MTVGIPRPGSPSGLYEWAAQLVRWLSTFAMRMPVTGECTLTASSTTTVVAAGAAVRGRKVFLSPRTSTAAATPWRVTAIADGSFTITHDSTAATDRRFWFLIA